MGGMLNFLPQVPGFASAGLNYGIFRRMRDDYASQVRHLRRREYQDMVHSMKEAGLNPMLATGATPGHSAAMQSGGVASTGPAGIGSAMAAHRQAGAAERNVKVTEVKAPYEVGESMMRRYLAAQQINATSAQTALTTAAEAKTRMETQLTGEHVRNAAVQRALMEAQAKKEGVSAREIESRIPINLGDPRHVFGTMRDAAQKSDAAAAADGGYFQRFINSGKNALEWMRENPPTGSTYK